jgi:flavorubredoxin
MFPTLEHVLSEIVHKGIKDHLLGIFGSFSWSGGGVKNLEKFSEQIQWQLVNPPVEEKGALKSEKYEQAIALANAMADELDKVFA